MKDKSGEFQVRLVLHKPFREKNLHQSLTKPIKIPQGKGGEVL
jgi:hypothetical protein